MSRQPSPAVKALTHLGLLLAVAVAVYPVLWVLKMAFSESQAFGLSASLRTVNSWLPDSTNRVSGIPGVIQTTLLMDLLGPTRLLASTLSRGASTRRL